MPEPTREKPARNIVIDVPPVETPSPSAPVAANSFRPLRTLNILYLGLLATIAFFNFIGAEYFPLTGLNLSAAVALGAAGHPALDRDCDLAAPPPLDADAGAALGLRAADGLLLASALARLDRQRHPPARHDLQRQAGTRQPERHCPRHHPDEPRYSARAGARRRAQRSVEDSLLESLRHCARPVPYRQPLSHCLGRRTALFAGAGRLYELPALPGAGRKQGRDALYGASLLAARGAGHRKALSAGRIGVLAEGCEHSHRRSAAS